MKAHVIHDAGGTIRSVVFQSTELDGELEIASEEPGDTVTAVDLDEDVAPGRTGSEPSHQDLSELGRRIRSGFEVDKDRGRLRRLKA
jgi:hypothetical protein